MDTKLACTKCQGTKTRTNTGFTALDGTVYPTRTEKCSYCDGEGFFHAFDVNAILALLTTKRGAKNGAVRFKASAPCDPYGKDKVGCRAYYVWRLARFHGGKDVTMPMTAEMVVTGDPCLKELDMMADIVAKKMYGTNMAGAARWAPLLTNVTVDTTGLPSTAQVGGPVVADEHKPEWEQAERF